jgi:hypothetical protein
MRAFKMNLSAVNGSVIRFSPLSLVGYTNNRQITPAAAPSGTR